MQTDFKNTLDQEDRVKCYMCGKPADFIVRCFIKAIAQTDSRYFCGDCIPKLLQKANLIVLEMEKIDNYDFRQLIIKKIFTPEFALEALNENHGPEFAGERTEAFFSQGYEQEEITFIKREKLNDDSFHLLVLRIHIDALYESLSWNNIDYECVQEHYLNIDDINRFKIFLGA